MIDNIQLLLQCLLYLNPSIGLEVTHLSPDCMIYDSGSKLVAFNRVLHTNIPTPEEITAIKTIFGQRPFSWIIDANDSESAQILEKNGLKDVGNYPVMNMSLLNLDLSNHPQNIEIKVIEQNNIALTLWAAIISKSFNRNESELLIALHKLQSILIPGALTLHIGYLQGTPAAAGCTINHGQIASLHWIGTLPEFRNQGLGSALTRQMVLDAQASGCSQAILFASQLGRPVYEKLGFHAYSLMKIYETCQKKKEIFMNNKGQNNFQELVSAWQQFLKDNPWQGLLGSCVPLHENCGTVYELTNFLNRPNENFAIVDMRVIPHAEPHYHPENDYEFYFVLQGTAIVVVGKEENHVKPGDVVVIPPNKAHFTIPDAEYVIACVNTPPYNPEHYIKLTESNTFFEFDKDQFDRLRNATSVNS